MTAVFLCLDFSKSELFYLNCGHQPVMLKRNDSVKLILEPGNVLGLMDDIDLGGQQLPLQVGDRILVFTDGLTENLDNDELSISSRSLRKMFLAFTEFEEFKIHLFTTLDENYSNPVDDTSIVVMEII